MKRQVYKNANKRKAHKYARKNSKVKHITDRVFFKPLKIFFIVIHFLEKKKTHIFK